MDTKLILVEGIPGSGKTTIAKRLYDHLVANNIKTNLYLEGDIDHPIDLGWYAYFCKHDYENFISDYSEYDSKLK